MPKITFQGKEFAFPAAALGGTKEQPRLKPADELLLNWLADQPEAPLAIYHDREGVLATCCYTRDRQLVADNVKHNQAAMELLLNVAHPGRRLPVIVDPLQPLAADRELILLQVPKTPDLFELYLAGIAATAGPRRRVAAAFQTRHFSPKILEIAGRYAQDVSQSRAYKKARLLYLNDLTPGKIPEELYYQLSFNGRTYYQYYGVFSANHIDYATQFLLEEWATNHLLNKLPTPATILDIGCGNGVIIDQLAQRYPKARLFGSDVSQVAISSTAQNNPHVTVHRSANLSFAAPQSLDLIVTNPPFHDGHRNAIGPTLELFREAREKLTEKGHLVLVANRHLNYATHLDKLFSEVIEVAENKKFVVYRCGQE